MIEFVEVSEADLAEMRNVNQMVRDLMGAAPSPRQLGAAESRAMREQGRGWMGSLVFDDRATDRSIATEQGEITVRVVTVPEPSGVYLHIHGGGWTLGRHSHQDRLLTAIADGANVAVVSVDYRLAPEHPFPAGPDDCEAAAVWLIEHALAEFGSDRLTIGGESAGGHLAALT
jgi:acetyl esterase/lipase